jgi:hypothetical protein
MLRSGTSGLAATVVAETPEAARLLQDAGVELRRRLEQHGVDLVRLEVSVAGRDAGGAGRGDAPAPDRTTPTGGGRPEDFESAGEQPGETRTIALAGGVLIDVIA